MSDKMYDNHTQEFLEQAIRNALKTTSFWNDRMVHLINRLEEATLGRDRAVAHQANMERMLQEFLDRKDS